MRRWFWLLSDNQTIREISGEKAWNLAKANANLENKKSYRVVATHKGDLSCMDTRWISRRQMEYLIRILLEDTKGDSHCWLCGAPSTAGDADLQ